MPFTPTDKTPGDPLRSQDWNDHIHEMLRLEAAKVNRSGDTITGDLTINGALNVSKSSPTPLLSLDTLGGASASLKCEHRGSNFIVRPAGAGSSSAVIENSAGALLLNPNGGNIGIGTSVPDTNLTIQGAATAYLNLKTAGSAQHLLLGADAGGGILSTMTNHDLQLRAGGNSTKMVVQAGGNIGIGTTAPGKLLQIGDVNVSGSEGMLRLESRSNADGASRIWDIGVPQTGAATGGEGYSFVIRDVNVNATRLIVRWDNGFVGIGTSTPTVPLHFPDVLGDKISLWGTDANAHYGFGIQGGTLQVYTGGGTDKVSFGWGGSNNFHETTRIHGDGTLVVIGDAYLKNGGLRILGTDPGRPAMRMICGGNYDAPMGCSISRPLGVNNGYYRINFNQAFNMRPFGSVTQIYPFGGTSGGDTRDNAVIVNITNTYIDLVTGDSGGNKGDRYFGFVFMGW